MVGGLSLQKNHCGPGKHSRMPRVAIIGGGISGLVCADVLAKAQASVVVFDTGARCVGGRMSSRVFRNGLVVDHACQFFSARDPAFVSITSDWVKQGWAQEWTGEIGIICDGVYDMIENGGRKFIGHRGVGSICTGLASRIANNGGSIKRPMWVNEMRRSGDGWNLLDGKGRDLGYFDWIVISHSGKCAVRLTKGSGADLVYRSLNCSFAAKVRSQDRRTVISSIWSLVAVFDKPLPVHFEGAFLQGSNVISWVANNTAKVPM